MVKKARGQSAKKTSMGAPFGGLGAFSGASGASPSNSLPDDLADYTASISSNAQVKSFAQSVAGNAKGKKTGGTQKSVTSNPPSANILRTELIESLSIDHTKTVDVTEQQIFSFTVTTKPDFGEHFKPQLLETRSRTNGKMTVVDKHMQTSREALHICTAPNRYTIYVMFPGDGDYLLWIMRPGDCSREESIACELKFSVSKNPKQLSGFPLDLRVECAEDKPWKYMICCVQAGKSFDSEPIQDPVQLGIKTGSTLTIPLSKKCGYSFSSMSTKATSCEIPQGEYSKVDVSNPYDTLTLSFPVAGSYILELYHTSQTDPATILYLVTDQASTATDAKSGPLKPFNIDTGDWKQFSMSEQRDQVLYGTAEGVERNGNYKVVTDQLLLVCENDYEKAKIIYIWVCLNIGYDMGLLGADSETMRVNRLRVFERGIGICGGYATLYRDMGRYAGLLVDFVGGYSKSLDHKRGSKRDPEKRHAWNVVHLERTPILLDCCWGAGCVSAGENATWSKSYDEYFFNVPAYEFVSRHHPEDNMHQYIWPYITLKEFDQIPTLNYKTTGTALVTAKQIHTDFITEKITQAQIELLERLNSAYFIQDTTLDGATVYGDFVAGKLTQEKFEALDHFYYSRAEKRPVNFVQIYNDIICGTMTMAQLTTMEE